MLINSIYMIICQTSGLKYIGSTELPIQQRFNIHKSHYKRYINQKASYISSVEVFKGNNAHVILLEEIKENQNISERELFYIKNFNCVNKNRPCKYKYIDDYNQYHKDYYNNNKDYFKNYYKKKNKKNIIEI
jgi:hypothetical protein